jgi:hypothetical protein
MKKQLAAGLIAVSLSTMSSIASAAETDPQEPMLLTAAQMDDVTAGRYGAAGRYYNPGYWRPVLSFFNFKQAAVTQINISPVVIIQIGNNNYASVVSGNFASIFQ